MTQFLATEDAIQITGILGQSIRDVGLLAGAIARPATSVYGEDAYPDLSQKIAALIDGINRNHPLVDGNKRLSWLCARNFANLNGYELRTDADEGERVIFAVARGSMDLSSLTEWTETHLSRIPS